MPSPGSPQPVGTAVTVTAAAAGCAAAEYQFWRYDATGWSIVQPWGTAATWTWPAAGQTTGTYYLAAWARAQGSGSAGPQAQVSLTYVLAPPGCTSVMFTPSPASPQQIGTSVVFTAAATGCAVAEYQFWRYDATGWSIVQPWGTAATWTWPAAGQIAGAYYVAAWARAQGSNSPGPQAQTSIAYTLTTGPALTRRLTAGQAFSCVLLAAGAASCWGLNNFGQLGTGTTTNSDIPASVVGVGGTGTLAGIVEIAAGGTHACARVVSGAVYCWGANASGQLGNNGTASSSTPVQVVGVGGTGTFANAAELIAGFGHTCARTTGGAVYCWGSNNRGQLGNNSTTNSRTPVQVVGVGGTGTLANVTSLAAGLGHTCARTTGNTAVCWGGNVSGQLGDNTTTQRTSPVQVVDTSGTGMLANVAGITAGGNHSCARTSAGAAFCWGTNFAGQLGNNSLIDSRRPVQVVGVGSTGTLADIAEVTAGAATTCARTTAGTAFCWGQNDNGELGNNSFVVLSTTPVQVLAVGGSGTLAAVLELAAGDTHACARVGGGGVVCWGDNASGQIGDNTTTDRRAPVQVLALVPLNAG